MAERISNIDRWRQYAIDSENRKQRQFNNKLAEDRIKRDLDIAESRRKTAIEVAQLRRQSTEARLALDQTAEKRRMAKDDFDQKMAVAKDSNAKAKLSQDYKIASEKLARDYQSQQERIYQFDQNLLEKQWQFDHPNETTRSGPRGFVERTPTGGAFGEKERVYFGTPEYDSYQKEQAGKQAADAVTAAQSEAQRLENERLGLWGRLKRAVGGAIPPPMPVAPVSPAMPGTNSMQPPPMPFPATETGTNRIGVPLIVPTAEGEWDLEGGMRVPPMTANTNAVPSAVAPQFVAPPLPPASDFIVAEPEIVIPTNTPVVAPTNTAPQPSKKVRVKGPRNQSGFVPEGTTLPEGWSLE